MVGGYFSPRLARSTFPQEVVVELTNHCNLACVMCPQKSMRRIKGMMEERLYRKVIDEISGSSELVYLFGTGESLIHPKLDAFIAYAAEKQLYTVLSTNGMLMDEDMARMLLSSRLDYLIVALDGGTKETYENIRIKGNFDVLVRNIKTLLNLKRSLNSKTNICLQMIYMPENDQEITLFRSLFTEMELRGVNQFRFKPLYKTYNLERTFVRKTRPCYWLWNMMSIYWNGEVSLCCMDSDAIHILGNVEKQSVEEVWNSDKLMKIREMSKNLNYKELTLCNTCDIPEQGYFNFFTIFSSIFFSARQVRKLIPVYEKLFLLSLRN